MKTFLVILKDKSKQRLADDLLQEHVAHLKRLTASGNLIICGPFADDSGAMLVLCADSVSSVNRFMQADPFIQKEYYAAYTITEFYSADAANNYLMSHDQTLNELNRE